MFSLKIGIDMDGVMVDTIRFISKEFSDAYGRVITPDDIVHRMGKIEGSGRLFEERGEYLLCSLAPMEHAAEVINGLGEQYEIVIISARFRMHYAATLEWLKKYGIRADAVIFTEGGGKADICVKNGIDLLIEDSLSNAIEVSNAGIQVLLMSTEYNRTAGNAHIDYCDSWDEIDRYIRCVTREQAAG
jgi:uncharacterized HAD superfamily protein